jgi:hypothetical protein
LHPGRRFGAAPGFWAGRPPPSRPKNEVQAPARANPANPSEKKLKKPSRFADRFTERCGVNHGNHNLAARLSAYWTLWQKARMKFGKLLIITSA